MTNEQNPARKILIVDDMELNRDILSIIFSPSHELLVALNGQQALDLLREEKENVEAILLDYIMPEMNGLDFLEQAKKEDLVNNTPVFLITSEDNNEVVQRAYSLGVMDYIFRPISPYIVQRRVESVMELFSARRKLKKLELFKNKAEKEFGKEAVERLLTST